MGGIIVIEERTGGDRKNLRVSQYLSQSSGQLVVLVVFRIPHLVQRNVHFISRQFSHVLSLR
jgi:hypothetical protein